MSLLLMGAMLNPNTFAGEPEIAEISFLDGLTPAIAVPSWVVSVEQDGGEFVEGAWVAGQALAVGTGSLSIKVDRRVLNEDVALTISYEEAESEMVIQLYDDQGRAVALDLFANVFSLAREAQTDTFIVPLRKHPNAARVVLRRVAGHVKIYGLVLFPVATESPPDEASLRRLSELLGTRSTPDTTSEGSFPGASTQTNADQGRIATRQQELAHSGRAGASTKSAGSIFVVSSMSSRFALVGIYQGKYEIHGNSVDVLVSKAVLHLRDISEYRGRRQVDHISVALGESGGGSKWNVRNKSNTIPVGTVMRPGEKHFLRDLEFSIPIDASIDLSQRWLVFTVQTRCFDDDNDRGPGNSHAHSERDVFQSLASTP